VPRIKLGDISIEVVRKTIKNVHLSVLPPSGRVKIAAPERIKLDALRLFAIDKLAWIRREQRKMREQAREAPREYLERESHYVWGRRYLLKVIEREAPPAIELKHNKLCLYVRPRTSAVKRHALLEDWYRAQLRRALPTLLSKWQPLIGVKVNQVFVQRMKTKWGGCNAVSENIRLNTDLAKKPPECLEYILVHELTHLIEPTHNERFRRLLEQFMPRAQFYREELNRLPVRHEAWSY
jgi:predicted metal-dependent hydrolase